MPKHLRALLGMKTHAGYAALPMSGPEHLRAERDGAEKVEPPADPT
jgi:hypothetical protein